MVENENFVRYLAEDDDFFILVEPDLYKINFATVKAIEKWRNLSLTIDENSQVACIFNKKQPKTSSIKIMFENEDFFASEINKIEARIKNSKVSEISMVESFLYSSYQQFLE